MGALEELLAVAKSLDTKLDQLIANQAGTPLPTADKPARKTKSTETAIDKANASSVTADQVRTEFDRVKGLEKAKVPELKKVIADLGYATLGELLTHPEKFEGAMTALKNYEESLSATDDAEDL